MTNPIFRLDRIMELCTGKSVLHLGYIQHSHLYRQLIKEGMWVHANIAAVASEITGIDYLEADVDTVKQEYGYDGYFGDANHLEEVPLQKTFDVIVCGELIEHITNPGQMLEGIKRFMHKGSILIITTPNPWGAAYVKKVQNGQEEESWINLEHVSWFSFYTLKNMLSRHGYKEISYNYYFGFETAAAYHKNSGGIRGMLSQWRKRYLINTTRTQEQLGLFFVCGL